MPRPTIQERFWAKVRKTDTCWLWTASTFWFGHGKFKLNGKNVRAHRLSWMFENGEIPDGLSVLHSCDTPACVRPSHLFLGTQADNMIDRANKGRGLAGLRPEDALLIRDGGVSCREIVELFDIDPRTYYHIRSGQTWRHLAQADITH